MTLRSRMVPVVLMALGTLALGTQAQVTPAAGLPVAQSVTLKGITVLENATVIPYYVRSPGYCRAVVSLDSCGTRLNHSESAVSTDPLIAAHHRAQTRSIPPLIGMDASCQALTMVGLVRH